MKRILFYYPSNKRTVSLETLFRELSKRGHRISFLSMCERGDLHQALEKYGIETYAVGLPKGNPLIYYFKQLIELIIFCRKYKIDVIFSHLQIANLVAVFADFFIPAKVITFRHHDFSRTKNESIGDKIINRLAESIVVPSSGVKNLMLQNEKLDQQKIILIPYIYDFSEYEFPLVEEVAEIRSQYELNEEALLLIMVARHVPAKRHTLVFKVFSEMIGEGYDLRLLVLDEGPEKENHVRLVKHLHIEKYVHFIGFTRKVTQYLTAADLMIHPSYSEASNSAVKEAGILQTAVAVCKNVGDFSDYIKHGVNGFLMNKENPEDDIRKVIEAIYRERSLVTDLGINLKETVISRFSLNEDILEQYEQLISTGSLKFKYRR